MQVRCLCWENPLEECMATHSNILAWRIPWTEEPGPQDHRVHRVTKSRTRQQKQLSTRAHKTLTGVAPGDERQGAPSLPVTGEERSSVP